MGGGSDDVTAVRPLLSVALEMEEERPAVSPRACAVVRVSGDCRALLREEFVPEVEEDFRCEAAAARALVVWFAACL